MSVLDWISDLVARALAAAEWTTRITALRAKAQASNAATFDAAGPEVLGALTVLETEIRQQSGQHRPARQAYREYEREVTAVAATGKLTPAYASEIARSVAFTSAVGERVKAMVAAGPPPDRARAAAAITKLYEVLELPGPPRIDFAEPGYALDFSSLPPPVSNEPLRPQHILMPPRPGVKPQPPSGPPKGQAYSNIIGQHTRPLSPQTELPAFRRLMALGRTPGRSGAGERHLQGARQTMIVMALPAMQYPGGIPPLSAVQSRAYGAPNPQLHHRRYGHAGATGDP